MRAFFIIEKINDLTRRDIESHRHTIKNKNPLECRAKKLLLVYIFSNKVDAKVEYGNEKPYAVDSA